MSALNYDRWSNLDSDDSGDEDASRPSQASAPSISSSLAVARSRKAEGDRLLEAVNNRRAIDAEVSSAFAGARSLYEGSLAAIGAAENAREGSTHERDELKKSCHLNIVAGALQEHSWAVALDHCEKALAIDAANVRALEVNNLKSTSI